MEDNRKCIKCKLGIDTVAALNVMDATGLCI